MFCISDNYFICMFPISNVLENSFSSCNSRMPNKIYRINWGRINRLPTMCILLLLPSSQPNSQIGCVAKELQLTGKIVHMFSKTITNILSFELSYFIFGAVYLLPLTALTHHSCRRQHECINIFGWTWANRDSVYKYSWVHITGNKKRSRSFGMIHEYRKISYQILRWHFYCSE